MNNDDLINVFNAAVNELQELRKYMNLCPIDRYSCMLKVNALGDVLLEYENGDNILTTRTVNVERVLLEDIDEIIRQEVYNEIAEREAANAEREALQNIREIKLLERLAEKHGFEITGDNNEK